MLVIVRKSHSPIEICAMIKPSSSSRENLLGYLLSLRDPQDVAKAAKQSQNQNCFQ